MPLQYYKAVLSVTGLDTASLSQMDVDLVSAYQKVGDGGHFGRMISAEMKSIYIVGGSLYPTIVHQSATNIGYTPPGPCDRREDRFWKMQNADA